MKVTQVSKKAVAMGYTLALALAVMTISGVSASAQAAPAKTPVKHVLSGTYYDASSPGGSASCGTANCTATINAYTENIPCPGAAGVQCTYEVGISAEAYVNANGSDCCTAGIYQFLIDGAIPTGGGTNNGFYNWAQNGSTGAFTSTYNVTSQVKNTSANQSHSIVVNFGCYSEANDLGCSAVSGEAIPGGFLSLTVRVLKP